MLMHVIIFFSLTRYKYLTQHPFFPSDFDFLSVINNNQSIKEK